MSHFNQSSSVYPLDFTAAGLNKTNKETMKSESWQWDPIDTKSSFGNLIIDLYTIRRRDTYTLYPNIRMLGKMNAHVVSQQHKRWISARDVEQRLSLDSTSAGWSWRPIETRIPIKIGISTPTQPYSPTRTVRLAEEGLCRSDIVFENYCLEVQTCWAELLSVSSWLDCEKGE